MLNHLSRWAIGDFYVQNGSGLQLTSYHLPFSIFLVFVQAVKWKTQVSKKIIVIAICYILNVLCIGFRIGVSVCHFRF